LFLTVCITCPWPDYKNEAKAFFETKCSTCHKVDTATSKKKSAKDWGKTVRRMKNVRGAQVTDEEAQMIIDYLAKYYGKE